MSKASILRQLPDADLEEIHQAIRRDALSDLKIARMAEKRLGRSLGDDQAAAMVIARYRVSQPYQAWIQRWLSQDNALRQAIETQKQRFEFVSSLVRDTDKTGLEQVSNGLMARLLTLAAEMPDDDLLQAAGRKGWIKQVIAAVQDQSRLERQRAAEQALETVQAPELTPQEREARIKEIFGIPA